MSTVLPAPARAGHLDLARAWAAQPDAWPVSPRFDPTRRWYHRLDSAADHEVWLLTWLPGQATELHDHGPSAGAFVVVSGELSEQSWAGGQLRTDGLRAGQGRAFGRGHVHRILNTADQPATSLHVYGPALAAMTRYRVVGTGLEVVGVDRAGVQW